VVYAGLPGTSSFVRPLALDSLASGGVLLWASQLGSGAQQPRTAGVRLDAGLNPVRSGTVPLDELLPGVPTLSFDAARPGARGARLVITTRDGGEQFQPPQFGDFTRVTWIDVPASGPLNAATSSAVAFDLRLATAQAVFADRVLVFSGSSVNVVWLNAGR
jgi:hypothetical protein